ncbi:MAG TPA: papain-like cysteine protease family protein [Fimbriimonadaceae bacterium]|nr:papain-like cysteine protease family protein [Fimbriimonadaceae bacterium]
MQHQQQTQWCWSATSVSTSLFYNAASTWTQCVLVNDELSQTTCCVNGSTNQCNQPNVLTSPLQRTGNLDSWQSGTISFNDVKTRIGSGHPVAVRIGWSGGGGHFVVIGGYIDDANQTLLIRDPWYGDNSISYTDFLTKYQGTGSWTHTYFTKA